MNDGIQTLHFAATHALGTGFHSLAGLKLNEILSWPCSSVLELKSCVQHHTQPGWDLLI